ncbi:MAG TPA: penicillin-binding transpeptidase domain-containing protein, partial [Anaerolineales bacterium]|nr:penicillin-binding transpeptidase domain-containing protein [Anaerolineales bacterium]
RWLNIVAILTLLSACTAGTGAPQGVPTASLQPPIVTVYSSSNAPAATDTAENVLKAYLDAFKADDYNTMYSLISKVSQDATPLEDFAKRNRDALNEMSAGSFDYEILSSLDSDYSSQVSYRVTYHTALVGDIQRDIVANLSLENNTWRLKWDDGIIIPELAGGNVLRMDYQTPSRGNIYDSKGETLVAQTDAFAFYIIPGEVTDESIGPLVSIAARLCGFDMESLIEKINNTPAQYPIPLCTASEQESRNILSSYPSGLRWETYNSRYYFEQGVASNIVGYTQLIGPEELETYRRRGYDGSEMIGKAGIERWAENYLAGRHGGTLYVINPSTGTPVTKIGESQSQAAHSVYLTIDRNLQKYTEMALRPFTGAAVVIELNTGKVLAMATSPDFDSNLFQPSNRNNDLIIDVLNDYRQPLVNRAAQGQYPLGSVFKIITMAAGMESGLFEPQTPFDCQYEWTKLPDRTRYDWTYQHCQDRLAAGKECNTSDSRPSGLVTLQEGLMRSCNPYFWEIGYNLYQNNRPNDIANMARAFGLGQPTGIQQIEESGGNIPNPSTAVDVVNEAIGQGDVLVTPLQVARFIAAVGNGGTLYRPQLVEKIEPVEGDAITVFKPEAVGTLPIQPFRLQAIQEAMIWVVENPRGTANFRLRGLSIPVSGKTGTAESGSGKPHAWFAGYTRAGESSGLPDIAIAVIIENQGEGSDWAAPIFKRIVETYYSGRPQTQLWFEDGMFGPTLTPTPFGGVPTETPKPR